MTEEVSNKTILILVVLTILISTLGTFTVTSSVREHYASQVPIIDSGSPVQSGKVSLSLTNSNYQSPEPVIASPVMGHVVLKLIS